MFLMIEYEYRITNNRCFSLLVIKYRRIILSLYLQTRCQESISKQNTATRMVCKSLPQNRVILPNSLL